MSQENKNYSTLVSQNIKHWRETLGLSQKQLGKMLGNEEKTIMMWELGELEPDINTLGKISNTFRIEIGQLFAKPGEKSSDETKEIKEKMTNELFVITTYIEQLIATIPTSNFVNEKDIFIISELINIWNAIRKSYNLLNGLGLRKKQWIPNVKEIREIMNEKKIFMRDIANHLNLTERNVEAMLYGIKPISLDTAIRISMYLNCPVESIIRFTSEYEDA